MHLNRHFGIVVLSFWVMIATASVACAQDSPALKREMSGPAVAELQQVLDSLGYHITIDSKFGAQTENAVRTFQQDLGLIADGIVGTQTQRVLNALGRNRVHKVVRGDSLSLLAKEYDTTIADIMDANDLTDDTIYIGQKLVIPARSFISRENGSQVESASKGSPVMMTYQVQPGESAYVIARRFNTTIPAITEVNNLNDPSRIRAGQQLLVPAPQRNSSLDAFLWPVLGPISSGYGWRIHPVYKNRQFHGGLDIAVSTGTDVLAAASGKVIRAEDMDGFGFGVVIDHGDGVTTWYGHNSKLLVKKGDTVKKGQAIAKSGSTGVSTGPHLDFRIKIDGNTVNPLSLLPDRKKLL